MYPGGAPMSRLTLCFSMYSDMSICTRAFSSPNMKAARRLASSVLPTPVGPAKMKLPMSLVVLEPLERHAGHLADDLGDHLLVDDAIDLLGALAPLAGDRLLLL